MKRLPSVDLSQFPALFQPVITRDPTPEELARIQSAKRRAWHELDVVTGRGDLVTC